MIDVEAYNGPVSGPVSFSCHRRIQRNGLCGQWLRGRFRRILKTDLSTENNAMPQLPYSLLPAPYSLNLPGKARQIPIVSSSKI